VIRLRALGLSLGGRPLLENADAAIAPGENIALIGPNGSGKTTLLRVLAGELGIDAGTLEQPCREVVRLEQSPPTSHAPAWRYIVDTDPQLLAARSLLASSEASGDGNAIALAHDAWEQAGGHRAEARARELLAGLGFSDADALAPVDTLSGGWRMRLNLARALFARSDLLLLDEPTNHLDLDAILWLERWLARYEGTAVIVSHDRDFLDRVAKATLSIEDRRLVRTSGGYSDWELQRSQRMAQAEHQGRVDALKIAHLRSFIDRFRAQATKARQVQSRLKALERIAQVAPLRAQHALDLSLAEAGDCPDPIVFAEDLDAGYGDKVVVGKVRMTIERGARIGILGRNGAGKTTLIRTLVGELPPLGGELYVSRSVRVGYFAQQGLERLRGDESPLAHLQRAAPDEREVVLRGFLGRFGLSGEDATRMVGPMSGGEKARLALALLAWQKPQLLVLDEPTNHLDASTRDALTEALADFDGALLLVSHDRYLLRAAVDRFVIVRDGTAEPFEGDLDEYAALLQAGESGGAQNTAGDGGETVTSRRAERRAAAEQRAERAALLRPIEREVQRIERELARVATKLREREAALAEPAIYADPPQAAEVAREHSALAQTHDKLEQAWLDAVMQRDGLAGAGDD
jgi:ATP-binding cassette subfamily F protein 3